MGYWPDDMLEEMVSVAIKDERGRAFIRALDGMIAEVSLDTFRGRDEATCAPEALPALIEEFSMGEYIADDLPVDVQRGILAKRDELQSRSGYDDGVLLGLGLLGMRPEIVQWHEQSPPGPANTHRVTVSIDQILYPADALGYFGERQIQAMWKMINATKRWSQETFLHVGVAPTAAVTVAAAPGAVMRVEASCAF